MGSRTHILAIPLPLQGHINPMLQLCKRLASKGIHVTLVTTAATSTTLQKQTGNNLIDMETVPDCTINEAENLDYYENFLRTFRASITSGLPDVIQKHGLNLKAILYDSVIPWTLEIAHQHGLKGAVLFTQPCTVCSVFYHLHKGNLVIPLDDDSEVSLPGMPVLEFKDVPSFVSYMNSYPSLLRALIDQFSTFESADWRLFNTFDKLEHEVLNWMANQYPILTIGPTVPSMYTDKRIPDDTDYGLILFKSNADSCIKWLDTKENCSVIYVSFGSLLDLGEKQTEELYRGLIDSEYNFLWVFRDPKESKLAQHLISDPPEKSLIVNWCPQLQVLSHKAVGCFITHCGWNSTLEALSLGVPMVCMPQRGDQTTNAKLVEDVWKCGVRVKIDENGIASREKIAACVKDVVKGETRRNAVRLKEMAIESVGEGGSSDKNMANFVSELSRI